MTTSNVITNADRYYTSEENVRLVVESIDRLWNEGFRAQYAETWDDFEAGNLKPFPSVDAAADLVCSSFGGGCTGVCLDFRKAEGEAVKVWFRHEEVTIEPSN